MHFCKMLLTCSFALKQQCLPTLIWQHDQEELKQIRAYARARLMADVNGEDHTFTFDQLTSYSQLCQMRS